MCLIPYCNLLYLLKGFGLVKLDVKTKSTSGVVSARWINVSVLMDMLLFCLVYALICDIVIRYLKQMTHNVLVKMIFSIELLCLSITSVLLQGSCILFNHSIDTCAPLRLMWNLIQWCKMLSSFYRSSRLQVPPTLTPAKWWEVWKLNTRGLSMAWPLQRSGTRTTL